MAEEKNKKEEGGKRVDGVVKLSREEIEKSRQIVLETIGEAKREAKKEKPESSAVKKVDGVVKIAPEKKAADLKIKSESPVKTELKEGKGGAGPVAEAKKLAATGEIMASTAATEKPKEKPLSEKKKKVWREEIKKLLGEKKKKGDKEQMESIKSAVKTISKPVSPAKPKKELTAKMPPLPVMDIVKKKVKKEEKKTAKSTAPAVPADDFISPREGSVSKVSMVNFFRNKVIQQRIEERKKRLAAEAARKAKEKRAKEKEEAHRRALAAQKKKEEVKKKEREKKRRAQKKKARAEARKKKIAEFKKKIKQNIVVSRAAGRQALCRVRLIVLFSLILGIFLYSFILVIVLRFGVDNTIFRKISAVAPLPAFITRDGVIEYYDYQDMVASWQAQAGRKLTSDEIKVKLVERLILVNLCQKYGISILSGGVYNQALADKLQEKVVRDKEINAVGLNRIKKIKQLIDKEGQFIKIAAKYGDQVGQVTVGDGNADQFTYGSAVKDMQTGEVSDIIFTPEGYYIFRCYDRDINGAALSYVFVRAKTLAEYLPEAITGYRIISLVKDR